MNLRRIRRFYRRHLHIPLNFLRGKEPVVIYTVGKVGSTSIYESLPEHIFWVQVHTLNPQVWEQARQARLEQDVSMVLQQSKQLRGYLLQSGRKAKYITVVREPLSRNISAFFQGFKHLTGHRPSSKPEDQAEQARIFLEQYPHERVLNFFDDEYKATLGLDVYAETFPFEQGYQRMSFEHGELLILRTESDDALKEKAIAEYLDLPEFRLKRSNVRDDHHNAEAYRVFKQSLVLPSDYVERMLESRFCRHFYNDAEREALKQQWIKD